MEDDLNIFENERRPQFFQLKDDLNFVLVNLRKLIFGMQHCFNLTRLNMEDDLNLFENGRQPIFFQNGRLP